MEPVGWGGDAGGSRTALHPFAKSCARAGRAPSQCRSPNSCLARANAALLGHSLREAESCATEQEVSLPEGACLAEGLCQAAR